LTRYFLCVAIQAIGYVDVTRDAHPLPQVGGRCEASGGCRAEAEAIPLTPPSFRTGKMRRFSPFRHRASKV